MNYGMQHHIGYNPVAPTTKTTTATLSGGNVYKYYTADKRCRRDQQGQMPVSTAGNAANGFLKSRFLPKAEQAEQPLNDNMEGEFYNSLSRLTTHYGFEAMLTRHLGFPYNMAVAMWDADKQLGEKGYCNLKGLRLVKAGNNGIFLSSTETYDTGTCLYYIPVVPLYHLLRDKNSKRGATLLVSVCTYLYRIADIPYYRQRSSYVYWQYQMLSDWMDEEAEEENTAANKRELLQAEQIGDKMESKLSNRKNLDLFYKRITGFIPRNEFEKECLKLANEAYSLYTQYPDQTIFRKASYANEDADMKEEVIEMAKYISFVSDTKGWLFDTLAEVVNSELNEYGITEEPTICKNFDGQPVDADNLDFENRLFSLLDDVCALLNNDKNERP